jgi:hypothetical protein
VERLSLMVEWTRTPWIFAIGGLEACVRWSGGKSYAMGSIAKMAVETAGCR